MSAVHESARYSSHLLMGTDDAVPRAMSTELIHEVVAGYASAAVRIRAAGLDGVEIVAGHGYPPAQFLDPAVNLRENSYGGAEANRLRFLPV